LNKSKSESSGKQKKKGSKKSKNSNKSSSKYTSSFNGNVDDVSTPPSSEEDRKSQLNQEQP